MKDWVKTLRRASKNDRDRIGQAVGLLEKHIFPPDTKPLTGMSQYRTRIGDWRIKFHYVNEILIIDEVRRKNENTYK